MRSKNIQRFDEYFKALWSHIKKKVPKSQTRFLNQVLLKHSQKIKSNESTQYEYLKQTLSNYDPLVEYIMKNDEFMFTPEFNKKSLYFMEGYDFKRLWRFNCLKDDDKKFIFRLLKLIYIQLSLSLNKNDSKVKQMVEVIKSEDEIEKEARENPNAFDDEKKGGLSDITKLFGNDELLSELAKDISEEVNLQETLKDLMNNSQIQQGQNPLEAMMNICQNQDIQNMVNNLQTKVAKKMQDRNIKPEDIQKSAGTLQDNLMGALKGVPGGRQLQRMMKNMNLEKMMQNTAQNMEQQQRNNPTFQPDPAMAARQAGMPSNIADMMKQMQEQMETNPEMRDFMNQLKANTNTSSNACCSTTSTEEKEESNLVIEDAPKNNKEENIKEEVEGTFKATTLGD